MFKEFWAGLDRSRRAGFVVGVALIAGLTVFVASWLLRTDYDVLFASLAPQDAAAMTAELDRMKVPYRLSADGSSILVDRSQVPATRLKLMGKDLPLHGAVGFELFNNSDFGMTEFAQKINYQRALQGELTRTIVSLAEVESARVHLAFPEEGLFKRDQSKAKAAVTLALRHGQMLRPEQVSGIQRLVSAAVAGISPSDVTIVNQQGVALTRVASADSAGNASARFELKSDIEHALARKVSDVLEQSFGVGRVMASVDVALDMNQVRVTTEDVRGQAEKPGETATGVIVRERETVRDPSSFVSLREGGGGASSSFRETEYQVGRRVEQLVTQPGSIQKLQVVAVIKDSLDAAQLAQVKALIGAAVGAVAERGDTVVVHSMGAFSAQTSQKLAAAESPVIIESADGGKGVSTTRSTAPVWPMPSAFQLIVGIAMAALVLLLAWMLYAPRTRAAALSEQERSAALLRVRQWLGEDARPLAQEPGRMP